MAAAWLGGTVRCSMFTRALRRHVTPGDVSLSPSIPLLRNGRVDLRRRDLSIDHNGAALWPLGARRTAQRGRAIWPPKTSTFVAVLRLTGIAASCMAFETQVEKVLLPELKCGDIVGRSMAAVPLDNAGDAR